MSCKLHNGDCLEIMQQIPDKSIDCICCDLPYGITSNKWDSIIPLDLLWQQYNRIAKDNAAVILFASMKFGSKLIETSTIPFRYDIIWNKEHPVGFLNAHKMPMRIHELILVFYKKLPTFNPQMRQGFSVVKKGISGASTTNYGKHNRVPNDRVGKTDRYPISILSIKKDKGIHPTQKPLLLIENLVKSYTNEGDLVLDNCMGSGTTGLACIKNSRNFIGIEKEKEYYDLAEERITNAGTASRTDYRNEG